MAICVSTYYQRQGKDYRYVLPFIFYDVPDLIDGKNVLMHYVDNRSVKSEDRPSGCVTVKAGIEPTVIDPGGWGAPLEPGSLANMVWQTFRAGLAVTVGTANEHAHVVKVVKLT